MCAGLDSDRSGSNRRFSLIPCQCSYPEFTSLQLSAAIACGGHQAEQKVVQGKCDPGSC